MFGSGLLMAQGGGDTGAYRRWRVLFSGYVSGSGSGTEVEDVEFRGVIGGPDLTLPSNATTNRIAGYNEGDADEAFDGASNTWWTLTNAFAAADEKWVGWDFVVPTVVVEVFISMRNLGRPYYTYAKVQGSADGVTWDDVFEGTLVWDTSDTFYRTTELSA